MKQFVGYYLPQFLEDVENDAKFIYDSVKQNKKVAQAQISKDMWGDRYVGVESKDGYYRKLYVNWRAQIPDGARKFFRMGEAINWLSGTNNAVEYNLVPVDISKASWSGFSLDNRYHEIKNTWASSTNLTWLTTTVPSIKRIEQNIKNRTLYTTVIWEDGSKPTVVKCAKDDPDDLYFAVASAIAIKMCGSNSAFKRMIHEKYGGLK